MTVDRIPLACPDIEDDDIEAVVAVLRGGRLSCGPALTAFENAFARYLDVPASVRVSSGTGALMLALETAGVRPGDQVITVSLSFVATANAIVRLRAEPIFVDVRAQDLDMDPDAISAAVTERTRAIVVVHLFGQLADMEAITDVAARHGLAVIEDACEALGASSAINSSRAGTLGDVGVFGFYPNKPITTAEGGIVVSRNASIIDACRRLRNQGRELDGAYRDAVAGFNFRLSELHAALGLSQLKRLPEMLDKRQRLADRYYEALRDVAELQLPALPKPDSTHAWFTFPVRLPARLVRERDGIRRELHAAGIESAEYFRPIHLLPYYRSLNRERDATQGPGDNGLKVTEAEWCRLLALPLYPALTEAQIDRVATELREALERRSSRCTDSARRSRNGSGSAFSKK